MGKIFGYTEGLHAVLLIDIGTKLGLFVRLAGAPSFLTSDKLASELGLHPYHVCVWCEIAYTLKLLGYDHDTGHFIAPFMDEIRGQPDGTFYLGLFPQYHLQIARNYTR